MDGKDQEKDPNLEEYFQKKRQTPLPKHFLDGYTDETLEKLKSNSPWVLSVASVAVPAVAMVVAVLLWWPRPEQVPSPLPSPDALAQEAFLLEQLGGNRGSDPLFLPVEDILPQLEMLDGFLIAMADTAEESSLEEEVNILMALEADAFDEDLMDAIELMNTLQWEEE